MEGSSIERLREVLNGLQRLRNRLPLDSLPEAEQRFLLDLRDHEEFFRSLADARLRGA
ncbi:MAG: hypothetical protein AB1452_12630 [Pseudomonadota bacterium]